MSVAVLEARPAVDGRLIPLFLPHRATVDVPGSRTVYLVGGFGWWVSVRETYAMAPIGMGSQKFTTRHERIARVAMTLVRPNPTSSAAAETSMTPRPAGVTGMAARTLSAARPITASWRLSAAAFGADYVAWRGRVTTDRALLDPAIRHRIQEHTRTGHTRLVGKREHASQP